MIQNEDNRDRHVVPRWNSIGVMLDNKELKPSLNKNIEEKSLDDDLEILLDEWKHEKSLPLAVEIITSSELRGFSDFSDQVNHIKEIVDTTESIPQAVKNILEPQYFAREIYNDSYSHNLGKSIRVIKDRLIKYPRNPLLWSELARNYLIIGNEDKAEKALKVAYSLAPTNRNVLRAISRFYLQINDPEVALYYLRNAPNLKRDPWLLSAEIAISNSINKTSKHIKGANRMIESKAYSPYSISELASELGTLDYWNGHAKRGKEKFKQALVQPIENSAAQISWCHNHLHKVSDLIETMPNTIRYNYESQVELNRDKENWKETHDFVKKWLQYQPFSSIPAMLSSFYYTEYELDNDSARKVLIPSIRSNPDNIDLINNYVYALLLDDDIIEAEKALNKATKLPNAQKNIPLIATTGLFYYRTNDATTGKNLYKVAIEMAKKENDEERMFYANLCLIREELRIGNYVDPIIQKLKKQKYNKYYKKYKTIIDNYGLSSYFEFPV